MSSTCFRTLTFLLLPRNTGNDPEQDSDQEPEPPVKVVDRTAPRRGKRDGPAEPQATAAPSTRGGRGGRRLSGNEGGK